MFGWPMRKDSREEITNYTNKMIKDITTNELNVELDTTARELLQKLQDIPTAPFSHINKTLAAAPHVNKTFVATCEIEDLFDSITQEDFTKIISERLPSKLLSEIFYHIHDNHPTNDIINIYLLNIYFSFTDWMIAMKAAFLGIDYTRYVDTLCFSTNDRDPSKLKLMLNLAQTELMRLSLNLASEPKIMSNNMTQSAYNLLLNKSGLVGKRSLGETLQSLNPTKVSDNDVSLINKTELRSSMIIYERLKRSLLVFESMGEGISNERIIKLKRQIAVLKQVFALRN